MPTTPTLEELRQESIRLYNGLPGNKPINYSVGIRQVEDDKEKEEDAVAKARADVEAARQAERTLYQDMINRRRGELESQRTADSAMAKFNALGNALTTMVQPIGWAVGGGKGVTAGVQPYDSRQYLESFNRAVRAADDIRNLGTLEQQYDLDFAKRDTQRAEAALERVLNGVGGSEKDAILQLIHDWTLHNNGMTLPQYFDYIEASYPGIFGSRKPDRETIQKIADEINNSKPKPKTRPVKPAKEDGKGKADGNAAAAEAPKAEPANNGLWYNPQIKAAEPEYPGYPVRMQGDKEKEEKVGGFQTGETKKKTGGFVIPN